MNKIRHLTLALLFTQMNLLGQGIPEPSLVMYGTIQSADGNIRLTVGTLTWYFQASGGGPIITATTRLTNINDQFSYILQIPWETDVGIGVSSNTLRLTSSPTVYNRSQVFFGTNQASFVQPTQSVFSARSLDRGLIERVDLVVSVPCIDSDKNGLCDWWEQAYFGQLGINADADFDGDGLSNLAEFKAGTDPTDAKSVFRFINVTTEPPGTIRVEWSSVSGRVYTLQRSSDLLTGFTNLAVNIPATESQNVYHDTNAVPPGPYFYRVRLQP